MSCSFKLLFLRLHSYLRELLQQAQRVQNTNEIFIGSDELKLSKGTSLAPLQTSLAPLQMKIPFNYL